MKRVRPAFLYAIMATALLAIGFLQGWNVSVTILNLCLVSAIMALGTNIQWGYAGLFNVGGMGFAALGGFAAVLSLPPVVGAWRVSGGGLALSLVCVVAMILATLWARRWLPAPWRLPATVVLIAGGLALASLFFLPATSAIENFDAARNGYLGGIGLPVVVSWFVGGAFAAAAAWVTGKVALGLRSDYLAIATLGISEIILAVMKNESWLTRGVKNVSGIPRPLTDEMSLREMEWFTRLADYIGLAPSELAGISVKLGYTVLFFLVLAVLLWLCERALYSPWGRMMRAIRDNHISASAMGKDVTKRHLQVFVLGSAVIGMAGAMLVSLDGVYAPGAYNPLRFTFLIWVMVIVGGSGNNWGAVLGAFLIWFVWVEAEPTGAWLMRLLSSPLPEDSLIHQRLVESAPHMRFLLMGLIMLLVLRFGPRGLIPETAGGRGDLPRA